MASRALVLGGGGITGIAWELGMLAGLAEAGVDLRCADLVVGTARHGTARRAAAARAGRVQSEALADQVSRVWSAWPGTSRTLT